MSKFLIFFLVFFSYCFFLRASGKVATGFSVPIISIQPTDVLTCQGEYVIAFGILASGQGPLSYQWQVDDGNGFVDVVDDSQYLNSNGDYLFIFNPTTALNGYLYRCVVDDGFGIVNTDEAMLSVQAVNAWTGAVNSDWTTAGNWSCNLVPTAAMDVIVNNSTMNNPVIAPMTTVECKNMTKGGFFSALTLHDASLKIYGNLTYNGGSFLTNSASSMVFCGSSLQTFGGLTSLTATNIKIDNSNGLLLNTDINATQSVEVHNGHVFTNNKTLKTAHVTGADEQNFIVTGDQNMVPATMGGLSISLPVTTGAVFPIGPNSSSYNPIVIKNLSGPTETFTARVDLAPLPGPMAPATVQRTWNIEESLPGGNNADFTLQWDETHEGSSFDRMLCGVHKSNGTTLDISGYVPQNGPAMFLSGTTWNKSLTGVTSFSPWGVTSNFSALPVELLNFAAEWKNATTAELKWHTAPLSTEKSFQVEKSDDGIHFSAMRIVVDKMGAHQYLAVDEEAVGAVIYYRLWMEDEAGFISYSPIVSLVNSVEPGRFQFAPTLVDHEASITITGAKKETADLLIIDAGGRVVKRIACSIEKEEVNAFSIDLSGLTNGLYFAKMVSSRYVATIGFVKQ